MNKTALLFAAAAAVASLTSPAFAQASGTVVVNGTVASRCTAVDTIGGTIGLGELAKSDGTVDKAFVGATSGLSRNFTVRCNGANPKLSVEARSLVNAAVGQSPDGYTNTVHYTASLAAKGAKGASTSVADDSSAAGATSATLADRLAAEANNITLTIANAATTNAAAILEAGTYAGSVDIVISPAA